MSGHTDETLEQTPQWGSRTVTFRKMKDGRWISEDGEIRTDEEMNLQGTFSKITVEPDGREPK